MSIIQVHKLTKDYGYGRGVFDVSFEVEKGEVFGFLGPNGAGKTTTIRHLIGFSNPDSGETKVNGINSRQGYSEILANLGYIPGEVALPEGLTGWEFISMMEGLRKVQNKERIKYLLDKFELNPSGKVKRMSLGVKRKLAIVTAFMSDPEVLILDEPTSGLDPVMQEKFVDFIKEEKKHGKTILLSSHIFSEVDATCDRIAIIKEGRLVSTVRANDIKHNQNKTYQIEFGTLEGYNMFLKNNFDIIYQNSQKLKVKLCINDAEICTLFKAVSNIKIVYLKEIKFTLQDHFMKFYEKTQSNGVEKQWL